MELEQEELDLELEELLPIWVDETGMLIDTMDLMNITAKPRLFANQITQIESFSDLLSNVFTEIEIQE